MHSRRLRFFTFALLLAALACPGHAQETHVPEYDAQNPDAPPVTSANLATSERFWPYHVSLQTPVDSTNLPLDLPGVLLRIDPDGRARIDFGRDGLHSLPVAATDLLANAERIRTGELKKEAPNFTFMLGARLVRSDADKIAPLPFAEATGKSAYLCLFAPTEADTLETIIAAFPATPERADLMTVVFPIGELDDRVVRQRLREAGRPWPFVYDHLSETYAAGLLPDRLVAPAVLLVSNEGRVLHAAAWSPEIVRDIDSALHALDPAK